MKIDLNNPPTQSDIDAEKRKWKKLLFWLVVITIVSFGVQLIPHGVAVTVIATLTTVVASFGVVVIGNGGVLTDHRPISPDDCEEVTQWAAQSSDIQHYVSKVNEQKRELVLVEYRVLRRCYNKQLDELKKKRLYG
jgi:hypothetical protein